MKPKKVQQLSDVYIYYDLIIIISNITIFLLCKYIYIYIYYYYFYYYFWFIIILCIYIHIMCIYIYITVCIYIYVCVTMYIYNYIYNYNIYVCIYIENIMNQSSMDSKSLKQQNIWSTWRDEPWKCSISSKPCNGKSPTTDWHL